MVQKHMHVQAGSAIYFKLFTSLLVFLVCVFLGLFIAYIAAHPIRSNTVTYHGASPVAFEREPQGYQTTNRR
jgi:hypothetical protein